jgi:hypothetical protein
MNVYYTDAGSNWRLFCGASLIRPDVALTAAQ